MTHLTFIDGTLFGMSVAGLLNLLRMGIEAALDRRWSRRDAAQPGEIVSEHMAAIEEIRHRRQPDTDNRT